MLYYSIYVYKTVLIKIIEYRIEMGVVMWGYVRNFKVRLKVLHNISYNDGYCQSDFLNTFSLFNQVLDPSNFLNFNKTFYIKEYLHILNIILIYAPNTKIINHVCVIFYTPQ